MLDHLSVLNAKISCVNDLDATSEALCIWLGIETQKGLSVTGAVVREKVLYIHFVVLQYSLYAELGFKHSIRCQLSISCVQ